jgi:ABC-type bacteriocin/lantibiotic exporter with double-glycine peptidase domain
MPIAMLVSLWLRRRLRAASRTFHRSFERFSRGTWLALEATDLTKMQAAEAREIARQRETMSELRQDSLRLTGLQGASTTGHSTLTVLFGGAILVAGGMLLARGSLTLGELMSFYGALALLRSSASLALGAVPQVIEGREAIARVDAALQEVPETIYTGARIASINGDVKFEHVAFGYDTRQLVLSDVSFHLRPGETIGITGESGTGKTTMSMLLLGLYRPAAGRILFDGVSIDELDVTDLRRQIGTMAQDPLILSESVSANIAFGLREVTDPGQVATRVRAAAELAGAHAFIDALPEGYATVLGTRGINLSGGQRQRIALARALIKNPRLLILDEPTNHLGTSTVMRVLQAVAAWPTPPAVLIISHDPELLMHLPRVLHLSDGRLVPGRATLVAEFP